MACHEDPLPQPYHRALSDKKLKLHIRTTQPATWQQTKKALEASFGKIKYLWRMENSHNFIGEFYNIRHLYAAVEAKQITYLDNTFSISLSQRSIDTPAKYGHQIIKEPLCERQLYITNLPYSVCWQQLKDCFREHGIVEKAFVPEDNKVCTLDREIVRVLDM